MSPPCINVRCDYFRHPKKLRLVGLLGRGADVLPIRLWTYCGEFHCEDGRLAGHTDEEIEAIAEWWGEKGKALEALSKVGFMEQQKGVWRMVDWREHQGHIYALKVRGRNNAKVRWDQYRRDKSRDAGSNASSNARAMRGQCSNQPYLPADPAVPPKGSGGGGGARPRKGSGGDAKGAGRFPVPEFTALPKPLFADKAKAMLADCEAIIADLRKSGLANQGQLDPLGHPMLTLLPEAREAIKAWQRRMGEIRQARAG